MDASVPSRPLRGLAVATVLAVLAMFAHDWLLLDAIGSLAFRGSLSDAAAVAILNAYQVAAVVLASLAGALAWSVRGSGQGALAGAAIGVAVSVAMQAIAVAMRRPPLDELLAGLAPMVAVVAIATLTGLLTGALRGRLSR